MRIYLAGSETWADTLLDLGVKNQLFSFFYFRQGLRTRGVKTQTLLNRMARAHKKGYRFMLDSGAFTYKTKGVKAPGSVPEPKAYFQEYLDFCTEYHELFDIFCEFDVDNSYQDPTTGKWVETALTNEWINRMLDVPGLAPKVMPVYHAHRGERWLNDWLKDPRSPLCGLGSAPSDSGGYIIAKAHRWGKYTHGFGQTGLKTTLKYLNFDAVDSSTWLRADQFGGTMIFRNDKLIVLDHLHKKDRALYKGWYETWGLDFKKIYDDDLGENRKATIITWRELSLSYEAKWFFRTGGKHPYMYQYYLDHGRMPAVHPLTARGESQ